LESTKNKNRFKKLAVIAIWQADGQPTGRPITHP